MRAVVAGLWVALTVVQVACRSEIVQAPQEPPADSTWQPPPPPPPHDTAPPAGGYVAINMQLGPGNTYPWALDDVGRVAGSRLLADGTDRAFLWDGTLHDLGPGRATALGPSGLVAGEAEQRPVVWQTGERRFLTDRVSTEGIAAVGVDAANNVAVRYTSDNSHWLRASVWGGAADEAPIDALGSSWVEPFAIRDGIVIGSWKARSYGGSHVMKPFRWADGAFTALPILYDRPCDPPADVSGCGRGYAYAMNSAGVIVGTSNDTTGESAVRWVGDRVERIARFASPRAAAVGINDRGLVAINTTDWTTTTFIYRAWLWHDGVLTELGSLGGGGTLASAINADGAIVGSSLTASGTRHAFVWRAGVMLDLGAPGGTQSHASAINARGDVVGCVGAQDTYYPMPFERPFDDYQPCRATLWRPADR